MKILLLRHGPATDPADMPRDADDAARPLTERGRLRTARALRAMASLGVRPDVILCSPLVRARQTADLARRVLAPSLDGVTITSALSPAGDADALLAELLRLPEDADVACVAHAPGLDLLLARLVGSPRAFTDLGKAGAARLVLDPGVAPTEGRARVRWIATPRMLRRAARA